MGHEVGGAALMRAVRQGERGQVGRKGRLIEFHAGKMTTAGAYKLFSLHVRFTARALDEATDANLLGGGH